MPRLRTDDAIRRTRLVYLGPQDYPLPWSWTYGQWSLTTCAALGLDLAVGFGLHALGAPGVVDAIAVLWSSAIAVFGTSLVYRRVNSDRPARAVVQTMLTDWRTNTPDDETLPVVTAVGLLFGGRR